MNSQQKYYMDDSFQRIEEDKKLSEDVVNILELFKLLSVEDKIYVKKELSSIKLF